MRNIPCPCLDICVYVSDCVCVCVCVLRHVRVHVYEPACLFLSVSHSIVRLHVCVHMASNDDEMCC